VLRYRLSRPESSGDACGASLCYREKSVDDPLSRNQRLSREQPFAVGPRSPHGPSLDHRDGDFPAEGVLDLCDYLAAFVKSSGCHPGDLTFHFGRGHDPMEKQRSLLYGSYYSPSCCQISGFCDRSDLPCFVSVEHIDGCPGRNVHPLRFKKGVQRAPDTVEETSYKSGTHLNGEGFSGTCDGLKNFKPVCVLVDLNSRIIAVHSYDLSHKLFGTDFDNLAHCKITHIRGFDYRTVNEGNDTFLIIWSEICLSLQNSFLL